MNNARLEFLFQRYRTGSCTAGEERELMEIITKSDTPHVRQLLDELWNAPHSKLPEGKAELILNSILAKSDNLMPMHRKHDSWLKVAAVVAFIIVSGAGLYLFLDSQTSFVASQQADAEVAQQHQFIKLPDGSKVILNNNSKLEFPDSFSGKNSREVYLTGEAFFDIAHDAAKPFIVHTGKISTAVLGTAFNIKAYPDQDDITVTVTRGRVKVSNEARVLGILSPDDQITFNKNSEKSTQHAVQSKEVITWAEKDIYFDDVSMLEAAKQLEERFQTKIDFSNENIKACRFTATFVKGEDLHQILDVICAFNQAKYTLNENGNIEVSCSGCSE